MTCLSFRCRHLYRGGFQLNAEFDIDDGVTALVGPSGSGKSTVLGMIAGILRPQTGLIRLGDQVLLDTARGIDVPPEKRRTAIVFQDHLLFPHLSVERNLKFGHRRRPSRSVDFQRVVDVLELRGLLRRGPVTLSGGERQRVALGRAILRGPDLLLMDEPLAALDAKLKAQILGYLSQIFSQWRIPTLFVSHDETDTQRIASRMVILDAGRARSLQSPTGATGVEESGARPES